MKLTRDFFTRPTCQVAQELLGKILVYGENKLMITETESYIGQKDPACHAAKGLTKRNAIMFGEAGYTYVYFIYGMYYCLNFVTEEEGFPAAVLIRGVKIMHPSEQSIDLSGPGKLCRYLNITTQHNGIDITKNDNFYLYDEGINLEYQSLPRVGIKVGLDKYWRYLAKT